MSQDNQIDPLSPVPRYRQVANIYRRQIQTGELAPGDQIPTRPMLMQRHGIARMTAHKALQILIDEGLVVTVPGVGAYVRCDR